MGNSCQKPGPDAVSVVSSPAAAAPAVGYLEDVVTLLQKMSNDLDKFYESQTRTIVRQTKVDGDYFFCADDLWSKSRVTVRAIEGVTAQNAEHTWKREGEAAASLISEKIKEADGPFLRFCKMPSTDDIGEVDGSCSDRVKVPDPAWVLKRQKTRLHNHSMGTKTKNIFGTKAKPNASDPQGTCVELAHATPQDLACSLFWPYYLQILTGELGGSNWQRFCAVHGYLSDTDRTYGDAYEYQGLKNLLQNLLGLAPGHYRHFDGTGAGSLIIIPIIDLKSEDAEGLYGIKSRYDLLVVGRSEAVSSWIYNGMQVGRANLSTKNFDEFV